MIPIMHIKRKLVENMRKISKGVFLLIILFCSLNKTLAYYNTSNTLTNDFYTKKYNLTLNGNGGIFNTNTITVKNNSVILPIPQKEGYGFIGYVDKDNINYSNNINDVNIINNNTLLANWEKNYYTVNYYVNNSLWQQRIVGYNDPLENLNAQNILDDFHKFNGWNGWIDKMPSKDVNLYANISEAFCRLTTGHGAYGNASGILNVFQSAGWNAKIIEQPLYPGNYLVQTEFNLTRSQAEYQKQYIASHTNYNSYNYPYLFWVAISCTNGYDAVWTRNFGQANFN